MRKILALIVSCSLLAFLAPAAIAGDSASGGYLLGGNVRVFHGIQDVPTGRGISLCILDVNPPDGVSDVCIGGRSMVTSECLEMLRTASGNCDTDAAKYMTATMTIVDGAFGNNVYGTICLWHTASNDGSDNTCNATPDPLYAHVDARADGCGVELVADAAGIDGHIGNYQVTGFAGLLTVEPTTNQVCIGSTGELQVAFA